SGVSQKRPTGLVSAWRPQLRRSFCYSRGSTPIKRETKKRKTNKLHLHPRQEQAFPPFRVGAVSMDRCRPTNSFPLARRRSSITLATRGCSLLTARGNRCGVFVIKRNRRGNGVTLPLAHRFASLTPARKSCSFRFPAND